MKECIKKGAGFAVCLILSPPDTVWTWQLYVYHYLIITSNQEHCYWTLIRKENGSLNSLFHLNSARAAFRNNVISM